MAGVGAMSAFTRDPQPVEVFHRGVWYPGELLGWRHDADGRCAARVRCVLDGLRRSAWVDLDLLRLPGAPSPSPVPAPAARPVTRFPEERDPLVAAQGAAELEETRPHVLLPRSRSTGRALPPTRRPPVPPAATPARPSTDASSAATRTAAGRPAQRRLVAGRTTAAMTAEMTTTPGPGAGGRSI